MRRRILVSVIATYLMLASPAHADQVMIMSFISGTCGDYIKETPAQRQYHDGQMLGYITAANNYKGRNSPKEASGYRVWVEEYCKQHPFSTFFNAIDKLDDALGPGTVPMDLRTTH